MRLLVALAACSHAKPPIVVTAGLNRGIDGIEMDDVSIDVEVNDRRMHDIAIARLQSVPCSNYGKRETVYVIELQLYCWKPRARHARRDANHDPRGARAEVVRVYEGAVVFR